LVGGIGKGLKAYCPSKKCRPREDVAQGIKGSQNYETNSHKIKNTGEGKEPQVRDIRARNRKGKIARFTSRERGVSGCQPIKYGRGGGLKEKGAMAENSGAIST